MRRIAMCTLLALSLVLAGCGEGSGGGANDPIKVGLITSLTGNYTPLGTDSKKAVELAVQQFNDAGGLDGRKIQLIVRDDQSRPDQSVLAFKDIESQDVVAVLGSPFSNSALATIPQVEREKVPYISLTAADEQVKPVKPYVFTVPAIAHTYAARILQSFQAEGITKIALANDTKSSYAVAGARAINELAGRYGVTVVQKDTYITTATDFSPIFTHTKDSDAQALVMWATGAPGVIATKQYAASGLETPLVMTGPQATQLWLKPVGKAAEGVTVASAVGVVGGGVLPDSPQKAIIDKLNSTFEAKYGYPPPQFAADGYSGVLLLTEALKKAGTDREGIRDALESMTLVTPNGRFTYSKTDHSGLGPEAISINTVKDGEFVPTKWSTEQLIASAKKS